MRFPLVCAAAIALVLGSSASAAPEQSASFTLQVSVTGAGTVTSSPGGIDCPGTCSAQYTARRQVTLSATPADGWTFSGWAGSCSGTGQCNVTMSKNESVSATFAQIPKPHFTLTVTVAGSGSVTSSLAGIACPGDCSATYDEGTLVTLAPLAGANAIFTGWGGACTGLNVCVLRMGENLTASAAFIDRRTPPPQTRPAPDTGKPDRGSSGPPYRLDLPFICLPSNDLWLDRVYRDVLGRPVDQAALDALGQRLAQGASRRDVALLVLQSVEYRTKLIQGWYQQYLKRAPSGPELAAWLGVLQTQSPEQVQASILGSSEYFQTRGGGAQDGFLDALFQDVLGRAPTSAELNAFKTALDQGATRAQVATDLLTSKEAKTKLVQGLYQDLLHRPPTQAEIDALWNLGHETIEASILGADEYYKDAIAYEATVRWGDGTTSPGTVRHDGRRCTVVGTHDYANNGRLTLRVDVTSPDATHVTLTRPLTIVPPPLPPAGKTNVRPTGTVLIKKGGKFVPLTGFAQLPAGTEIDTRKGKVTLTAHDGSTGQFYEGVFRLGQERVGKIAYTTITLTGGDFGVCKAKKRKPSGVTKSKPPKSVRHVWGNAKGRFRTKGKYASATIRGTLWLTDDRCPGTSVTVRRGVVDVYDFVKRKHVLTPAGKSYLAKPKG